VRQAQSSTVVLRGLKNPITGIAGCCARAASGLCENCHDRKMAGYRPDVLTDPAYRTDEPIDED
jgi:hypothetical protein